MKKQHIKAIQSQAQYLKKIVKDIESLKRGRKLLGGEWFIYPKQVRVHIVKQNGNYYKPSNIKTAIAGMDDVQMAKLMRFIISFLKEEQLIYSSVYFRRKGFYQRRINGNIYLIKRKLCDKLFGKE